MKLKWSLAVAAALTSLHGAAHAGFFVSEDTPQMASVAGYPATIVAKRETTLYVSFFGTRLSRSGRAGLEEISQTLAQAEVISINAVANSKARLMQATRRAYGVKDWMTRNGIDGGRITILSELDADVAADDTDVQVVAKAPRSATLRDAMRHAPLVQHAQQGELPTSPRSMTPSRESIPDQARIEFARRILMLAQRKAISNDDALRLVADLLSPAPPAKADALPGITPAASATPPSSDTLPRREWVLSPTLSLRDNLAKWASDAGYMPVEWSVADPYQVQYEKSFAGTYLEVLSQVSEMVPALDFKVSPLRRTLRVLPGKGETSPQVTLR
ncbi:hypothetical protein LMG19282_01476 [Cupriavidus campinensis]|nr:TcpQ domain-containing protein [Cupriavidus campinensis]CAG2138304.1 hypothetical protein LMG19282_01476 [Cupriavidus campinensis]